MIFADKTKQIIFLVWWEKIHIYAAIFSHSRWKNLHFNEIRRDSEYEIFILD